MTPEQVVGVMKRSRCLYTQEQVELAIDSLAACIELELSERNPIILCVMTGGMVLAGKLLTRLNFPLNVDYIHATRYQGATQGAKLNWKAHPTLSLQDRTVVVVDDILDEGATLAQILEYCREQEAAAVYSSVLVDKQHERKFPNIKADYVGLEVEDYYVFGYGMDYHNYLRNAPGIFAISEADL